MIGKKGPFPELFSSAEGFEENGFIASSDSTGCGHEDSMNRLPDPNAEWTNEESGEGKDGMPNS